MRFEQLSVITLLYMLGMYAIPLLMTRLSQRGGFGSSTAMISWDG